jgi:TonB family protein
MQAPLDITVLRSGIPDTLPGRAVNVCERGISAMLAGELVTGEAVGIEVQLPQATTTLRTRAMVRYQDRLRCGLEFVGLSADQRGAIREWTKGSKAEIEIGATSEGATAPSRKEEIAAAASGKTSDEGSPRRPKRRRQHLSNIFLGFMIFATIAALAFWWRWNRGWEELESGLKISRSTSAEKPQAQVSAEVMQKLLIHRVEPAYPAEARKANLQGIVALDIVVGRDGSVISMHALNGPEVLARAAMDALRWWKFEPYRVNGEPAVVETTVAVEFRK